MTCYDVFNGDADGICALVQLRLAEPREAKLVTGVKRDINLLERVRAKAGDHITALDISMRTNAEALRRNLKAGANIFYADHHNPGDIPKHENLFAVIDTRPTMCTSLLVNTCLKGQFQDWAIVGAFGDNLNSVAAAFTQNYKAKHVEQLKQLGQLINYNAYGRDVADLHFAPDKLFNLLARYETPQAFLENDTTVFQKLKTGYSDDLSKARNTKDTQVFILDDAPWARRISGSFGNVLAQQTPEKAHAVLTHNEEGGYTVSVRAQLENLRGADTLCLSFPTGGGRAGAAGINHLPEEDLDRFIEAFKAAF